MQSSKVLHFDMIDFEILGLGLIERKNVKLMITHLMVVKDMAKVWPPYKAGSIQ